MMNEARVRRQLSDGRVVEVATSGRDGRSWWIEATGSDYAIDGVPLNSCLAEVLGFDIVHVGWPDWVDDLADEIAAALGRPGESKRLDDGTDGP
jgi:hypothetical protein